MKKWVYSIPVKVFCILLSVLFLSLFVLSSLCIVVMIERGGYYHSFDEIRKDYYLENRDWLPETVASNYLESAGGVFSFYSWIESAEAEHSFLCTLQNENGKVIYTDYNQEEYLCKMDEMVTLHQRVSYPYSDGSDGTYEMVQQAQYRVTVYFLSDSLSLTEETVIWIWQIFYVCRYLAIAIFFTSFVLLVLDLVFLCCSAGRRGEGQVKEGFFSRIFVEIYPISAFVFLCCQLMILDWVGIGWVFLALLAIFFVADAFLFVLVLMDVAIRIKLKTLFRFSLCFHLLKWMKKGYCFAKEFYENASLVPKVVLVLLLVALFDLFLATILDYTEFLAAVLVEGLVLTGILVWYGASIQRLKKDQRYLAEGKLDHRCDHYSLPPGLRSLGSALNCSAEGMERAVEEKMRSERFKTELITNVSHDIKTPLTSIINYVDLLKKEKGFNPTVTEYLEVLDRQSSRLKKLTEDLVESSKAASGVLPVELAPCDLKVLLEQAWGEYQSAFEKKGLVPCLLLPEEPCIVTADGKHLWRVLDNLMNNIVKYSLSGTRVYGTLERGEEEIRIIFRNISETPLNLSGDDLMERFVRGDASRHTEGSGLGLAIARSLVELQKGRMKIFVDGDLFRVTVSFDHIV